MDRPIGLIAALPQESAPLRRAGRDGFMAGRRIELVTAGMGAARAAAAASELLAAHRCWMLISFGFAAGLRSGIGPAETVALTGVVGSDSRLAAGLVMPEATDHAGLCLDLTTPLTTAAAKQAAGERSGALVADLETAAVAAAAVAAGVPWAGLRAVTDPVDLDLPAPVLAGLGEGEFHLPAFAVAAAVRPWSWPAIARLARYSRAAAAKLADALAAYLEGLP